MTSSLFARLLVIVTARPRRVWRPTAVSLRVLVTAVGVATTGACEDSPIDPLGGVIAGETGAGALALAVSLPSPAHEVWDASDPAVSSTIQEWLDSWSLDVRSGRDVRERLYPTLARARAEHRGDEGLVADLDALATAVQTAERLALPDFPISLRAGIDSAAGESELAAAAHAEGRPTGALEHVLRGSDRLREVGPEAVARSAVAEVEGLFRRISDSDPYSEQDVERISRLVRGSRQALQERDWTLAIRRAYYGKGLLTRRP